ncbi:MAG: ankyrin repeat domain-containing protein [Deltaproteobacteria bacterium]|nr:ankyrin repeat domain-containing protein [Deltaproteobacteria bacterium]
MRLSFCSCMLLLLLSACGPKRPGISLMAAVASGDLEKVKAHFYWGTDADTRDRLGRSPLHLAADRADLSLAAYLLAQGADPNARDLDGWTPLHAAAAAGSIDCARLLMDHGAEVDTSSEAGCTPLHWAAHAGSAGLVALLAERGAAIHSPDRKGQTPLGRAVQRQERAAARALITAMQVGAVDGPDKHTPLHWAALLDDEELAAELLQRGAEINARDAHGRTPASLAEREGHSKMRDFLVSRGGTCDPPRPPAVSYPEWVLRGSGLFASGGEPALYGVGLVSGIRNVALARTTADNRARRELLRQIELLVDRWNESPPEPISQLGATQVRRQVIAGTLHGAQIVDHWMDPADGSLYALARLDWQAIESSLAADDKLPARERQLFLERLPQLFDDLQSRSKKAGP